MEDKKQRPAVPEGDDLLDIIAGFYKAKRLLDEQEISDAPAEPDAPAEQETPTPHITEIDGAIIAELPESIMSHFEGEGEEPESLKAHFSDPEPTDDSAGKKRSKPLPKGVKGAIKVAGAVFGAGSFAVRLVFFIVLVLAISAYCTYFCISIANDVFALVKEPVSYTINIDAADTVDSVAAELEKHGVIRYGDVFRLYSSYQTDGVPPTLVPGDHSLNGSMNYSQIFAELTVIYVPRTVVRITIPEGLSTDEIIDIFLENGLGSREGYVEALNNYPYKHEFVQELDAMELSPNRRYRLDGYLFPDTYEFYSDLEEYLVINKLLNNFNDKFWKDYKKTYKTMLEEQGIDSSFDNIINLSSIVQAEGKHALDYEQIAYVFRNRLTHSKTFPTLQSDATVNYILGLSGERREDLTQADLDLVHPYNTYVAEGLPPGAICNPGLDAILGTLYPSQPVDSEGDGINAYYFVSSKAGNTYYSETLSGHNSNIRKVKKENEAYDQERSEDAEAQE